jgi:hypothetical protein
LTAIEHGGLVVGNAPLIEHMGNVAMGLAKLLGFDLCPRLAMLKERKLYVPTKLAIPKELAGTGRVFSWVLLPFVLIATLFRRSVLANCSNASSVCRQTSAHVNNFAAVSTLAN